MKNNSQHEPLTFGFDIGIASVGWAVLSPTRIVDMGVRCFDKAETADRGESLNLARRMARLMRRRLHHRAWRLLKVAKLLRREGLIDNIDVLKQQPQEGFKTPNLWQLRVKALDQKLNDEEWARVIYHICKHRGFHWVSKAEEKNADKDSEGGAVKKGLSGTKRLMQEKNYRTAAEMVINEFPEAQRNKRGEYTKALSRELLADELQQLFKYQRELSNHYATQQLELAVLGTGDKKSGLLWQQRVALSGESLLKMLGKCAFEKTEYRAPKASFSSERHVWLTRLNNLRIVIDGKIRSLTQAERNVALPLPYLQVSDLTYKQLRNKLIKAGLNESFRFAGLSYPSDKQKQEDKAKDPEEQTLIKLQGWKTLRSTLKEYQLEETWQHLSGDALEGKPETLDSIATVLSIYKEDDEVLRELGKIELPNKEKLIEAMSYVRFDKFGSLSLKALYKILPYMEQGLRYDEACEKAGYHHSKLHGIGEGENKYLPPFYSSRDKTGRMIFNEELDVPRNPVVLRALNQARKVANALIQKHGSPDEVHIEMARDLSRPLKGHWSENGKYIEGRLDVQKEQLAFQERNKKDRDAFESEYNASGTLKSREFEKWQLYREQQGKCVYSLEAFDIHRLFEQGYAEVDHALPYSRSYDDSKNNRVLVLARENRNKGNMTPYEYLDGKNDSERWRLFVSYVEFNKMYRQAKRNRLLKKDFGQEESRDFMERNLNDTRYICRFFKNYVERYLKLHAESETKRCVVLSGQLTSFLRARWGLIKSRDESDRHHALDAVIVATCTHSMVKRLSDYSRRKELSQVRTGFVDPQTGEIPDKKIFDQLEDHFPNPWPHFRQEVDARLHIEGEDKLVSILDSFGTYPEAVLSATRPLFISRAPQHRSKGALHEKTFRSPKLIENNQSYVRVDLKKLTLDSLERVVGAQDPRNATLISALRERLEAFGGNGEKAFSQPFTRPSGEGKVAPIVKTVKLVSTQKSGVNLGHAIADLGGMLNVDIYQLKNGKYFVDPVYGISKEKRINAELIPQDAEYQFSLAKNDFVVVTIVQEKVSGYFVMYESDGRLTLRKHDQPQPDKKYFRKGIASIKDIQKFNVDVLGNVYPAPRETRRDLA